MSRPFTPIQKFVTNSGRPKEHKTAFEYGEADMQTSTVYLAKGKGRTPRWTVVIRLHPVTKERICVKRVTHGDKRSALKLRNELLCHLANGTLQHKDLPPSKRPEKAPPPTAAPTPCKVTLSQFLPQYFEHTAASVSVTELERKRCVLGIWETIYGDTLLSDITQAVIDGVVRELKMKGRSPSTIALRIGDLKRVVDCALRLGILDRPLPIVWPKAGKRHDRSTWLTKEQINRLLDPRLGIVTMPLYRALFLLGVHAGLRVGEIRGLRWQDVDMESRIISVRWQCTGTHMLIAPKSGVTRTVPISDELYKALSELRRDSPSSWVIWSDGDENLPRSYGAIRRWWIGALITSGLWKAGDAVSEVPRDATPHCWRHTFATHLARAGVSVRTLQTLLGHTTPNQSIKYCQMHGADARDAIAKLSW